LRTSDGLQHAHTHLCCLPRRSRLGLLGLAAGLGVLGRLVARLRRRCRLGRLSDERYSTARRRIAARSARSYGVHARVDIRSACRRGEACFGRSAPSSLDRSMDATRVAVRTGTSGHAKTVCTRARTHPSHLLIYASIRIHIHRHADEPWMRIQAWRVYGGGDSRPAPNLSSVSSAVALLRKADAGERVNQVPCRAI
jgi:hypothetical protein